MELLNAILPLLDPDPVPLTLALMVTGPPNFSAPLVMSRACRLWDCLLVC